MEAPTAVQGQEDEKDHADAVPDALMLMMQNHPDGAIPDDIDFPRHLPKRQPRERPGQDDIPW